MPSDVKPPELVVVGAGPAGLAAAIYTTREDIPTTLYEAKAVGGWAGLTATVENYPGFPDGVSGIELSERLEQQAKRFGAVIETGVTVKVLKPTTAGIEVTTSAGVTQTRAVLIAIGSDYRRLIVPGEAEYFGRGVHYCATCDGPLYRGKRLVVVGGGDAAMQEGLFLTKFAKHVTMLVRGPALKGSPILQHEITANPSMEVRFNVEVTKVDGAEGRVTSVETTAGPVATDGVFVFIGLVPKTDWLKGTITLDERGFVTTDANFQTSLPGVYAAGDIRSGATWQIASAVGEGVTAALRISTFLKSAGRGV